MSVWDWYEEDSWSKDADRRAKIRPLRDAFTEGIELHLSEPRTAIAIFDRGIAQAEAAGEAWWAQLMTHWKLQSLLHGDKSYDEATAVASKAAVEVRKPVFDRLPQRICLHEDLITAYSAVDPLGHEGTVLPAIEYMKDQLAKAPSLECRFCVRGLETGYAIDRGRLDEAEELAANYLAYIEADRRPFSNSLYTAHAYSEMCRIAFRRSDAQALQQWAELMERAYRGEEHMAEVALSLAWQALALRWLGEPAAPRKLARASTILKKLLRPPEREHFYALAAYYEAAGNSAEALAVREREFETFATRGQHQANCDCLIACAELQATLGRRNVDTLARARDIAAKLRKPEPVLEQIDSITVVA